MLKKIQFSNSFLKRGLLFTAVAISINSFIANNSFAQDATYLGGTSSTFPASSTPTVANTVPVGMNSVTIQMWGAGGNGGSIGPTTTAGVKQSSGGGGGGGYTSITVPVLAGDIYTVTVGAAVVNPSGNVTGRNGFPSFVTGPNPAITELGRAGGGAGGVLGITGAGGAGGTGTTITGSNGEAGVQGTSGKGGNGVNPINGETSLGGASVVNNPLQNEPGLNGSGIGSGGSGAVGDDTNTGSKTGKKGGLGTEGRVIFTYSPAVLPVSLINFNTTIDGNRAKLQWSTASESNNNRFEVLRSTDNKSYVNVATITGKGSTTQLSNYVAYDSNPENGVNYYKLIQIDNDGTTKELAIKFINISINKLDYVKVYPNPASEFLNVQFDNSKNANSATLTLIGLDGKVSLKQNMQLNNGINNLKLDVGSNVAAGQYILNIDGLGIRESIKISIKN